MRLNARAPDYDGDGLINLMARLATSRGAGPVSFPTLEVPGGEALDDAPAVVFWLIDGLGDVFLGNRPDSLLARHRVRGATSVFPATTSAALTTVNSGMPPRAHAATGWFVYLREFGAVSTWLPFGPRVGRKSWTELAPGSEVLLERPALVDAMATEAFHLLPEWLVETPYTRATSGCAQRLGYRGLHGDDGLVERVSALCREATGARSRRYIYAYWPDLDARCHQSGVNSEKTEEVFRSADHAFGVLLERLRGTGACVVVSADHGLLDTAAERVIDVEEHPELAQCLALPLCGEPRAAYAYLRSGAGDDFDAYVREHLGTCCKAVPSAELVEAGWFGPPPEHPEFRWRIGDRVLLPAPGWVVRQRLYGEPHTFGQIGVHGGASDEEMLIPVILAS